MSLTDYHGSAGDWRAALKLNERKTKKVIALYFVIYLFIGFIADLTISQSMYSHAPLSVIAKALLTFKLVPYATIAMLAFACVSLFITYAFYDKLMLLGTEYREITPQTAQSLEEKQLYNVIEEMKIAAGLGYMPKVFIIQADYMNAFASGYSEKSAMVAITAGLLEKLERAEMQAVMAHELSHIRHHDIKLTLMVAVLSNIMLIVIDGLFYSMCFGGKDDDKEGNRLAMVILLLRYVLPVITLALTAYLSKTREYMADSGCVELMRDNEPLAKALLKISDDHQANADVYERAYGQTPHEQVRHASYLFDPSDIDPVKSLYTMFATHPTVPDRLKALGFTKKQSDNSRA